MAAAADIGARLREALEAADFLVVLCSPAAASSSWVEAEIATFCGLGPERRERVLAVVLAGDSLSNIDLQPASIAVPIDGRTFLRPRE